MVEDLDAEEAEVVAVLVVAGEAVETLVEVAILVVLDEGKLLNLDKLVEVESTTTAASKAIMYVSVPILANGRQPR